ncbi:S8 family serine peptidase [Virgibacillus sp. AGTR]|uniref:S8 family peptidase n=1 Tax=unclassified Virgibacillus TaxID=2620237 RepID=UPI001965D52E|nr:MULTISPECIES: S8 family peptidase [unclassified Virgibacillus]MCC2251086.1 S8 family serine peptidase [Virgibacillus sp. AGTR]MDY7044562.1 S8 family serine peptidase [Virgibacillus sp. M23]QRZ19910.1 S8 family serine peptidase [Virgibacillus sp. AGTR]
MQQFPMRKYIAVLLICILLITLATPYLSHVFAQQDKRESASQVIQSKLVKTFDKTDYVRYLVILKDQVNTVQLAESAKKEAIQAKLSTAKAKQLKQRTVVSALQENAEKTQQDLKSLLKKQKQSGNIKQFHSYFIVNAFSVTGNEKSVERIAKSKQVKSIILDEQQQLLPIEEDNTFAVKQTDNQSEDTEWNIERVGAPEVWERNITGEGTVVANIDSGVEGNHPALTRQYRGYQEDDPDQPVHEFNWHDAVFDRSRPMDSDGHGTHTMGTMVGQEEGGQNKIGVAPGAKWIATRAFYQGTGYDSYILEAAEWILAPTDENGEPHPEKAPDVVNNSWGGSPINNDWFRPMVQAWRSAGIVPIFSVGNAGFLNPSEPGTASAPANYPESIAVGATDANDDLASFSLQGPSERGEIKPDISAPGVTIRSSLPGASWDTFDYGESSGTSMAAPHVAAAILLMKQVDASLTVDEIENILKLTATEKTNEEYTNAPNNGYGYGILNVDDAVEAVEQGIGTITGQVQTYGQDDQAPTVESELREAVFLNENASFSVHAEDNTSVNDVTLHVQYDNNTERSYPAAIIEGNHQSGSYTSVVPLEDISGTSLHYWWRVEDFSGNVTESEPQLVRIEEGITDGYSEDFESYPDGWYSFGTNNSWEWGLPSYGPEEAASGRKLLGTNLRGQYEMHSDMTMVMPPILPENGTQLRFKQWYELSYFGWDTGTIYVSTDKENWEELYHITESNDNWHETGIDLSDYAGEKIYIGFNLKSQDNQFAGWYLDDVRLTNDRAQKNEKQNMKTSGTMKTTMQDMQEHLSYPISTLQATNDSDLLPVGEATIGVEETGWETKSNPKNGEFIIHHPPGDYTLSVNAYGYSPVTETVTLSENGDISPTISLEPLPKQEISGTITDKNGNKIENATIFLLEDEHAEPVKSSENGTYTLQAYEGAYTVKVFAEGYDGEAKSVLVKENEANQLDFELTTFSSNETSEIYYDNGDYGKNLAMLLEGNGFAVKMALDEGKESAMLTGAKLQFWASHVPVPGGDDILIAIYDATGENGAPGNRLAGPIEAKAKRDLNQWTEVDLSQHGIVVEDDFYVVYLQANDYPFIPGFVSDGDIENAAGKSWDYIGGKWFKANDNIGNYMIRAVVDYGKDTPDFATPVITSPEADYDTNEQQLTIEGTASPGTIAQLMNNDEERESVEVAEDGSFTIDTVLTEGENELTIVSLYNGQPVGESESVTVTFSKEPSLTIDSPKDGEKTNREVITVEGTVSVGNLDVVTVNGQQATVSDDGNYTKRVMVNNGENLIEVIAKDRSGNQVKKTITVDVNHTIPSINHLNPEDDVFLETGESVHIEFDSVPGLKASFLIHMPLVNEPLGLANVTELPMIETSDGHYQGFWTAINNLRAQGAVIEVKVEDEYGNTNRQQANGKLFIN